MTGPADSAVTHTHKERELNCRRANRGELSHNKYVRRIIKSVCRHWWVNARECVCVCKLNYDCEQKSKKKTSFLHVTVTICHLSVPHPL